MNAEQAIVKLRAALLEVSNDLRDMIDSHYCNTLGYPSQRRRYDRDMQPVKDAEVLLAETEIVEHEVER